MKSKNLRLDIAVLVPLEIGEPSVSPVKLLLFEKHECLNKVPPKNMLGLVDEDQIKKESTVGKVSSFIEDNMEVYRFNLTRNTGEGLEYETDQKERFLRKLKCFETKTNIFWIA
jgi:hypothetical protein